MLPIGLLITEHKLIEKFFSVIEKQSHRIQEDKLADIAFVDDCIDFMKTYAERCHHGKEESILFKELKTKKLSDEHIKILKAIVNEHKTLRKLTEKLVSIRNNYFNSVNEAEKQIYTYEIRENLRQLIELYPGHMKKEDKEFFPSCMEYFTVAEKDKLLDDFLEFDRLLIHKKYKEVVESYK